MGTLTKTGVIFGIAVFYAMVGFLLGIIPVGNAYQNQLSQTLGEVTYDFGTGDVPGAVYNATHNIFWGVSMYECADATGESTLDNPNFGLYQYDDGTVTTYCLLENDAVPSTTLWSFRRFTANIEELKWFNTLFLIPLLALLAFMFATSSALYNIE